MIFLITMEVWCSRFRPGWQRPFFFPHWSITLPVPACQVGFLSCTNPQGNPTPSTDLEIITGWHVRAVTVPGIKKLTCLQCWEACQISAAVSMNHLKEPGPNLEHLKLVNVKGYPNWDQCRGYGRYGMQIAHLLDFSCLLGHVQNG